jgi:molybdopterin converting factor small subunit
LPAGRLGDGDVTAVHGDDPATKPPAAPEESASSGERTRCRVELFGLARSIVGQRAAEVELPGEATVADALAGLAATYPALVGRVLRPDGRGLTEGHVLNMNGREFVEDLSAAIGPGDSLLILANTAGG